MDLEITPSSQLEESDNIESDNLVADTAEEKSEQILSDGTQGIEDENSENTEVEMQYESNETADDNHHLTEEVLNKSTSVGDKNTEHNKILKLPIARVKNLMKMDPDCTIVSSDAVVAACKAVELFLAHLGRQAAVYTRNNKRKVILKRDLDTVIENESRMCFLDGTLE